MVPLLVTGGRQKTPNGSGPHKSQISDPLYLFNFFQLIFGFRSSDHCTNDTNISLYVNCEGLITIGVILNRAPDICLMSGALFFYDTLADIL